MICDTIGWGALMVSPQAVSISMLLLSASFITIPLYRVVWSVSKGRSENVHVLTTSPSLSLNSNFMLA